ncbi:Tetratricopeptide TPR_2 repeat-containing protein [Actinobacteria bacterium OK074]|nr:Tetratricopeptide TPR_2 repeat-containing protein [Actinobacteria bacterium OK074]
MPAEKLRSEDVTHSFRHASTLLATGHYEDAVTAFSSVLQTEPNRALALASRAAAHRMLGQNDLAIRDASRSVELQPGLAWAYATRGAIHRLQKDYREALADLNKAIELQPDYEWCIAGRGETYRLMGQSKQALADLNRALELNPRNDWALMCRGAVYLDAQEEQEALRAFREAVSVNPDGDWALGLAALTYRLMGKDLTKYTDDPHVTAPPARPAPNHPRWELRISPIAMGSFPLVDSASSISKVINSSEEAHAAVDEILLAAEAKGRASNPADPDGGQSGARS